MNERAAPGCRLPALATAAAFGIPALLFLVRFEAFFRGGVFSFRDAGFFFVPWRTVTARIVGAGAFPFWNEAASAGRALAADPNAAIFWPLTLLSVPFGTTVLGLGNAAAALALFFLAARKLGLSRGIAAAGTSALLFSGVFQTLAVLFTSMVAFAPMALAFVAARALALAAGPARRRWGVVLAGALAVSTFGGEPAITVMAALGALLVAALAGGRRALLAGAAAVALGAALAGVQVVPAVRELGRSARGQRMRAEEGALFFSVRPARALTLLEPRLTGDPFAERDEDFWGAETFDARNPYFFDIAFGLVPLLLGLAATADPRARPFLAAAGAGAVLACARFLPGYTAVASYVAVFRYPEKWWSVATAGTLLAAMLATDALARGERAVARRLAAAAAATAGLLGLGALLAGVAPAALRAAIWGLNLGSGPTAPARLAAVLGPRLLADALTAAVLAGLAAALARGRVSFRVVAAASAVLFLFDAAARTAATCPAGDPALYREPAQHVRTVAAALGEGRFIDDGADDRLTSLRRARETGGFDQLRPTTGVLFGIRYVGDNDIDRMTPLATFEWTRTTATLPWGTEKLRRYRCAGVTVVRTPWPGPDPPGLRPLGRSGGDRLLGVDGTRPRFALMPRVRFVAPGTSLAGGAEDEPLASAAVEDATRRGTAPCGTGRAALLEDAPGRQLLVVESDGGGGCLAVARTHDPFWVARVDGKRVATFLSDGAFTALFVPPGSHRVELRYENPLFSAGGLLSLAALVAALLILRR